MRHIGSGYKTNTEFDGIQDKVLEFDMVSETIVNRYVNRVSVPSRSHF
jgi:hypothetical protein